ncbi:MAG: T9SS type A sorting domain-containing protein [Paludibacteraceae bacterium]|nr:T9SS type A sorting domain-containing protein [Paludibacteraceae bacterium]
MNRLKNIILALFILLSLMPSTTKAFNEVLEHKYNYSITPNGAGVYHFKIVAFSRAFCNHFLSDDLNRDSYMFIKRKDKDGKTIQDTIAVFTAKNFDDVDEGDRRTCTFIPRKGNFIINGTNYNTNEGNSGNVESTKAEKIDNQPTLFIEGDWVPDLNYFNANDMITFGLHIEDEDCVEWNQHDWTWGPYPYNTPCRAPVLMEPYIDFDGISDEDQGGMKILWSSSRELLEYKLVIVEDGIETETKSTVELTGQDGLNGEILLKPSNKLRKVHIEGVMYADDVENKDIKEKVKVTIPSNEVLVKPYMSISSFNVEKTYEKEKAGNKMKFTWEIDNPSEHDYMPSDVFVLQRAYFPDFSDAVNLTTMSVTRPTRYGYNKAIFEYEEDDIRNTFNSYQDSTELRNIFDSPLVVPEKNNKMYPYITIPKKEVYYRLQRSVASSVWDDRVSKRYRLDTTISLNYQLPLIDSIEVKKANNWELSRKADVNIRLSNYMLFDLPTYRKLDEAAKKAYKFTNIRLYNWDTNANIVLCRISQETGDTVKTTIKGSDVKLSEDSTYYYVNTTTETPEAFTHTSFMAYVDDANSVYSVSPTKKATKTVSEADGFYYEDCASIDQFTASTDLKDGIQLRWNATSGPISYYQLQIDNDNKNAWTTLKIDSLQTEFFDQLFGQSYNHDMIPGQEYRYKLTLVYEHNGKQFTKEKTTIGRTYPFYSIAGKVKTSTNTGIANLQVVATNEATQDTVVAWTKADGSYSFDSLTIEKNVTYSVSVQTTNGKYLGLNNNTSYSFALGEFTDDGGFKRYKTYYTGADFICEEAHNFSGRVLYTNSTIPVRGAHFKINGEVLYVNGKIVETDNNGNFSFDLPKSQISVQVVKEGHKFQNNGFIHQLGMPDSFIHFVPDIDYKKLEIQDSTRITLAGRIAGGDEQGAFPLGFNLSENILGDSITMVLELEGDNTAQIVYKKENPNDTEIDTVFVHHNNKEQTDSVGVTDVKYQRKRIVIHPDQKSGEFFVDLPPVKYKMTKLYAQGYSTLFNNGEAAQIIDLSADSLIQRKTYTHKMGKDTLHTTYNAKYSRIYHAPIQLTYKQLNSTSDSTMLGEEQLSFTNIYGEEIKYTLATFNDSTKKVNYTFKHPVFNEGALYLLQISANEEYVYNGQDSSKIKRVAVPNLTLNINNGLTTEKKTTSVKMDEKGTYLLRFTANNPTFSLTEEDALRHLILTVEKDGYGSKATPIDAFVTGTRYKGTDVFIAKEKDITLLDILRDPPGSGSSAYMEKGAKYAFTRDWNYHVDVALNFELTSGSNYTNVIGNWAGSNAGSFYGVVNKGTITKDFSQNIPITNLMISKGSANYTYTTNERIETSSDKYDVGAMYDIYIGTTTDITAQKMDVLSLIDYKTYKAVTYAINQGAIKVVAKSAKSEDDTNGTYLVVAEKVKYNIEEPVMFTYTQKHIIDYILPNLLTERDKLLITADSKTAQEIANATGKVQYYTSLTQGQSGYGVTDYDIATPENYPYKPEDEVANFNERAEKWIELIMINEQQKIHAIKSGKNFQNYSLSSSAKISHSEQDEAYSSENTMANIFDEKYVLPQTANAGMKMLQGLFNGLSKDKPGDKKEDTEGKNRLDSLMKKLNLGEGQKAQLFETPTSQIKFTIRPVTNWEVKDDNTQRLTNLRKKGFTLATANDGFMEIGVCRTPLDTFLNDTTIKKIANISTTYLHTDLTDKYLANYIFYVKGGATRSPYENVDYTLFAPYNNKVGGFPLGVPTLKIDNPKIVIEDPIRTNVPQDEKTTFKVTVINDTELQNPDSRLLPSTFTLKESVKTNADNVKIYCDGEPLQTGVKIKLKPGEKVVKTIEVERGTNFNVRDLGIAINSDDDIYTNDQAYISISYINSASPITLEAPTDKWVMNTYSAKDSVGFFIPVTVSGFNVNHEGFDHIEIQYKETNKGEEDWVTICSYYNDSTLFKEASGVKEFINSGVIRNARFYGVKDPTEMAYDIRAVSFSRFGNSFITRSSKVASGIKDTRCPKVFGTPEPSNGTLHFGDIIKLPFTEPIAYNILDETSNFNILGYKTSSSLSQSTALRFSAQDSQLAKTAVDRNLVQTDFTIDMMVKTDNDNTDMTFFSHGGTMTGGLTFGIDSEHRLTATINGQTVKSEPLSSKLSSTLTRVGMIYHHHNKKPTIEFFAGNKTCGTDTLNSSYRANGPIYLGTDYSNSGKKLFSGSMLEVRVWAKALNADELSAYNETRINGYKHMLIAHYPLTETTGSFATDEAHGADLQLRNTMWTSKQGHSLRTNAKPVLLDGTLLNKPKTADFTLSFWFKSEKLVAGNTDTLALFTAGGANKLFIGYIGEKLTLRSNGTSYALGNTYTDQEWHQFTMTVDRSNNISRCYVDGNYVSQIQASAIDGIASDYVALGNNKSNLYFDEFALWRLALPDDYIENYYNAVVNKTDKDLLIYLPFETKVDGDQGQVEGAFSIYNEVSKYDSIVDLYAKKEVIVKNASQVNDETLTWAPVAEKAELSKLDFTWSYSDNALLIKLLEHDAEINDQMVYLTVRNVEDLNGNIMQNPAMWSIHTNLNQLSLENAEIIQHADYGESGDIVLTMMNTSGSYRNYKITTSVDWLVPEVSKGIADPEMKEELHIQYNGTNDPGNYVGIVNLEDENGLVSSCIVRLEVRGNKPDYEINLNDFDHSMVYKGLVKLKTAHGAEIIDNNKEDIVFAFMDGKCVGKDNIQVKEDGTAYVYMTIYGTKNNQNKHSEVSFKVWNERTNKLMDMVSSSAPVKFTQDGVVGAKIPDTLSVSNDKVIRNIQLKKGWNWISINVKPTGQNQVSNMFINNIDAFSPSDIIKSPTGFDQYKADTKTWEGTLQKLGKDTVYQINVAKEGTYYLSGEEIPDTSLYVVLDGGKWEPLPYLLNESQPINTALQSLTKESHVQVGDVVKGLTKFAIFSDNNEWEGNLTHMYAGEGYFINLQNGKGTYKVKYTRENNKSLRSAYINEEVTADDRAVEYANNMPVIAQFGEDVDFEEDDKLVAYANGKKMNEADLQTISGKKLFLLSVNAAQGDHITFAQERNGKVIANTVVPVRYDADKILGSPAAPYIISFANDFVEVEPTVFSKEVLFRFHTKEPQSATIEVFNTDGACVWNVKANAMEQTTVNMNGSHLASGIYYATIKMGAMIKTVKLIKR